MVPCINIIDNSTIFKLIKSPSFSKKATSPSSSAGCCSIRFSTVLTITVVFTSVYLFISPINHGSEPCSWTRIETRFNGDLRDSKFPRNRLCFGNNFEKLKLAVFSKTGPIGAAPGGMERHAATLYPFEIFNTINANGPFDYVHTESVSLPHWRAKMVPNVAVTWHGIWYEIMYSKLFEELVFNSQETTPRPVGELHEAMPRLLPQRNVHVILNGVDQTKFVLDPASGAKFRRKHGIPANISVVLGVAGRLVRDKGHPLLYEAFSKISKTHTGVYLLVAGSGPWGKRYADLVSNVKVLGALEPSELSNFYNAIDVFVNPTSMPQGLDLTLMEAMHCGKPILTPNYPSIVGTVVVNQTFGYTFSPNVESFVDALESAIKDGPKSVEKQRDCLKKTCIIDVYCK
ncbi:putative malate dehydrogenase [Hibiscus syriacus]|uniref:Malate dehydrogenase n=1 Tax=Hibiscus syriacus TaxID=106335 RepID=A0A6A3C2S7_HIBSY|nr:putative malate dehydrogenase [Hibiscus syriacus]